MASAENERDEDETSSDAEGSDEAEGSDPAEGGDGAEGSDEDGEAEAAPVSDPPDASTSREPADAPADAAKKDKARRSSAGARLAAQKAAKAAQKAVKKAKIAADAEAVASPRASSAEPAPEPIEQLKESSLGQAATKAGEWATANQAMAWGLAAVLVLAIGGFVGWNWYTDTQNAAAGALLAEAVEIARADIVAEGEEEDEDADEDATTFPSAQARAEAALAAYRRVLSEHPTSPAAAWARLGEARTLAETGDAEGARAAYAAAIRDHGDDSLVALRAYEGAGFTYEAEEDWEHAREEYEHIEGIEDGHYRVVGAYHLARILVATGDRVAAQTALEEVIDEIEEATEGPEPPFPYVLAQAQARLRELDPSSASGSDAPVTVGGPGGGGGLPEGISPEVLEALRRAMGEGGGAPE